MTSARPPATGLSARTPPLADRLEAWGAAFVFGMNFGGTLARGIGPFLGVSKHARCNISRALPGLSETQIAGVVSSMWDNLGRLAADIPIYGKSASSKRAGGSRRTASSMSIGRSQLAGG